MILAGVAHVDPALVPVFIKNMYFLGVKSTAHPPIIGALGHSTHFIVKQPNTAMVNINLH